MLRWIEEYVKLIKLHDANACSWTLREKNLRALRARLKRDA